MPDDIFESAARGFSRYIWNVLIMQTFLETDMSWDSYQWAVGKLIEHYGHHTEAENPDNKERPRWKEIGK